MDDVAAAIADPVRRAILEALREGPLPARRIAARFPISRPAVSRHLRVLRESGLVRDTAVGRERRYSLDPAPLGGLRAWLAGFPAGSSGDSAGYPAESSGSPAGSRADFPAGSPAGSRAGSPAGSRAGSPAGSPAGDPVASPWDRRLDALETEVYRARRDRRRGGTEPMEDTA